MLSTLPNFISFLRLPLAFVFLNESPTLRAAALILAMLTDCLDGFLARRYQISSRFGTFLDPFSDKFFVIFILSIFIKENRIEVWQAVTMLCRDFAVILFGFYLTWRKTLSKYQFRSIWCGKITTTLQFCILLGLIFNVHFPSLVFVSFIVLGIAALGELYLERNRLIIR